jgi:hypothetical protein
MSEQPQPLDDDGGIVGRFLSRIFGRSYRTTIAGVVTVLAQGVALAPGVPPEVAHWAQVLAGLASGAGLLIAKDARVSGPK